LAYISNNSFIDGVIHRQMRKHLLETFDSIYILDLHGSNKKQETAPDGSKDENVFDIMQGVSINIFVKNGNSNLGLSSNTKASTNQGLDSELATVYHKDLYGLREAKYQTLLNNSLKSLAWNKIACRAPEYFFIAKDIDVQIDYEQGFSINELFSVNSSGIKTHRDDFVIDFDKAILSKRIESFCSESFSSRELKTKFSLKESEQWIKEKQQEVFNTDCIKKIAYRPFDNRYIYYSSKLVERAREKIMQHFLKANNLCLISCRQQSTFNFQHIFVSYLISDMCSISSQTKESGYAFPLYLYPEPTSQQSLDETNTRKPNLNPELIKQIAAKLGLAFVAEKNLRGLKDLAGLTVEENNNTFAPMDLLDYIYAVLHSPNYRETYKEFLKSDFPRVPYPELKTFWQLVKLGGELRKLHLLETKAVHIINYPIDGSDCITRKLNKHDFVITDVDNNTGQVWINDKQYFANVPLIPWTFYIGGYQPAQKWLKDRHGRVLSLDDIKHYANIINALIETDRIMKAIDLIGRSGFA
jgi:predicted helicase